ncbi:MAG: cytochrome c [Opitutae bacterium]|jgi:cytochrome c oxidase cbb3-type subunit II|nr:cytochrome c [Opitutae bacterium]
MNNIFKFSFGILTTLAFAWLAFVVGANLQYGDLSPEAENLEDDDSREPDAELFPKDMPGLAKQGAEEYLALGCVSCHTQQVRLFTTKDSEGKSIVEGGMDVERGWGKRASMARDYVLQDHVMLGNTRIGPDLANFGMTEKDNDWLHRHLFEPQSLVPDSICPPSPFLYEVSDDPRDGSIAIPSHEDHGDERQKSRYVVPSIRANRIVAYLKALKQDYELPELPFVQAKEEKSDTNATETKGIPDWIRYPVPSSALEDLSSQMSAGKEVYTKIGPGGGGCVTCHQPTGLGLPIAFPPLAGSDWVKGDKERLIKISLFGLTGEIEVNGVKFNGAMPAPGIPLGSLTDQQIADVLTFVRNSWGNSASAVSPSEVSEVRASIKDRAPTQMWTAAELTSHSKPAQ